MEDDKSPFHLLKKISNNEHRTLYELKIDIFKLH